MTRACVCKNEFEKSRGKRAISVRAIEVLLYGGSGKQADTMLKGLHIYCKLIKNPVYRPTAIKIKKEENNGTSL